MTITPNRADLAAYLKMIFEYADFEGGCVALRGTGEKGTSKEGDFIEPVIVPGIVAEFDIDRVFGHVQRWSGKNIASFIVPGVIGDAAMTDHKATEDRIKSLTTLVVDLDNGDTTAKLSHATKYLGAPSMVVHSGGMTKTLHHKLHVYWKLSEASDQVSAIAAARKVLALKLGGDVSFGRSTQVIRLPGSVYAKSGIRRLCRIESQTTYEYELAELLQAIADMPTAEGVTEGAAMLPMKAASYAGMNFSGFKEAGGDMEKNPLALTLTTPVHEGGDDDRNRWGEFNRTAGHYIHCVRTGALSLDEAKNNANGWMISNMVPPWPAVRFDAEWKSLLAHDVKDKGALPVALAPVIINAVPNGVGIFTTEFDPERWNVENWTSKPAPKRRFLVKGLIMAGKTHMLAAEGGAGKTFMLLDLAMKIAIGDTSASWCGMPLTEDAAGTVVMFTTEDDEEELRIRLSDIDPENRRLTTRGRLKILPTINIGGAFPLVERDRATGRAVLGTVWKSHLTWLRKIKDLKMVVIDTLNTTLHGEENNATVINEYIQAAASVICGELGAALIITHHVRKAGANTKIYSPDDMKNSIRGSTALIGAFRAVLGIWHAPDAKDRLTRLGFEPGEGLLYNFAVVKANNPEMAWGTRTLLRDKAGLLNDITDREARMLAEALDENEAWMLRAIEDAARAGHPFTITSLSRTSTETKGGRKHQLPKAVSEMSKTRLAAMAQRLIGLERALLCRIGKGEAHWLDVPCGPLASGQGDDGLGYKLVVGAAIIEPKTSWEHLYAYHPINKVIMERAKVENDPALTRWKSKSDKSGLGAGKFGLEQEINNQTIENEQ